MSDGVTVISILCGTAFIITAMICVTRLALADRRRREDLEDESRQRYHEASDRAFRTVPQPAPVFEYSKTERRVPEPAQEEDRPTVQDVDAATGIPPLPIDPKNPPRTILFPANEPNPPNCVCHGRKVKPGQSVVAWPDGTGYRFLCTEGQ